MNQSAINEYWGSLVARYRAGPLPGFLKWWRGELAGLFPQGLRRRMIPPRPVLWLLPEAEGRKFTVWQGGEAPEQRDTFGAGEDAGLLRDRWQELVDGFEDGQPEVRLCLPLEDTLRCPVELPLAVEANLSESLRYQLDQLTPFSADQVYFDYAIAERDAQHGRLNVDLRLATRARVDALRERLAAIGIRPHAIDCLGGDVENPEGEGFNMLPLHERPRHVYRRARINWLLVGGLVLVLAIVMTESLFLHQRSVERLDREVEALRQDADEVLALQNELQDALAAANFLAERRRRQPVSVEVLDEITRIMPDDIWLTQLRMQGTELMLQGQADQSQRLIELINDSELLSDAEFRGSVSIDPGSGKERFNAQARIETKGGARATAAGSGE
ncbi:PilN domain-containing protein [Wenzhouxiangella sp. EGI_FJ10409]|uniref:PilN domain-containing protein n=1 Tax=Wenzhouxiangella sp. EGI_FJ10409 TaxID=3243767 RepID=UPI0035DE7EDD